LYEVGVAPSSFLAEGAGPLILGPEGDLWGLPHLLIPGSPVKLATGTYSGAIGFNESGPNLGANVFPTIGALNVVSAETAFVIVPEPTTIFLAGLGLIGVVASRRRAC
jgi:hypothetical protein